MDREVVIDWIEQPNADESAARLQLLRQRIVEVLLLRESQLRSELTLTHQALGKLGIVLPEQVTTEPEDRFITEGEYARVSEQLNLTRDIVWSRLWHSLKNHHKTTYNQQFREIYPNSGAVITRRQSNPENEFIVTWIKLFNSEGHMSIVNLEKLLKDGRLIYARGLGNKTIGYLEELVRYTKPRSDEA